MNLPSTSLSSPELRRQHLIWLCAIAGLVLAMVGIGGITRLTGSGLSITDWSPFMGAIPPLSDEAWQTVFEKYRASPQYRLVNEGMSLADFQFIFFWEYFHRLVGRLIGIAVLVPGIYFWFRGQLSRRLAIRVYAGFLLGGMQGALGWFMVKSGLVDRPSVSHFRLAAHLILALLILAYFVWLIRDVLTENRPAILAAEKATGRLRRWGAVFVSLLFLQILFGAFVAGLKAGFTHNTFPLMNGQFLPEGFMALDSFWLNLFENPLTIQWVHRYLGKILFFVAIGLGVSLWRHPPLKRIGFWVMAGVGIQFILGVLTLINRVPLWLGVVHQFAAAILVVIATVLVHQLFTHTLKRPHSPFLRRLRLRRKKSETPAI